MNKYALLEKRVYVLLVPLKGVIVKDPVNFIEKFRNRFPGLIIQFVKPKYVRNSNHLIQIIRQAWIAKKRGISKSKFDIDLIQRLACDSRVSKSILMVGINSGRNDLIAISIGDKKMLDKFYSSVKEIGNISEELLEDSVTNEHFLLKHHNINKKMLKTVLDTDDKLVALLLEKAVLALV